MKAAIAGIAAAIVIAVIGGVVLNRINVSSADRFSTPDSVRLGKS